MVSIISTWVSCPIVRRISYFFIVSRLSRQYTKPNLKRINLHRWQRQSHGETFIHGLLECESTQCKSECGRQTKKWNRNALAECNFRRIWHAYIQGRQCPDDLTPRSGNRDRDNYGEVVRNRNLQQQLQNLQVYRSLKEAQGIIIGWGIA